MMSPDALVINTSRGGVVDESAVISALSNGRLGGAALDVFETEPLDSKSGARFSGVPNLILTPHVAGITTESEARIGDMTVATVRRHLGPT
jgi:(S)-sulfolactate dehydrogenase